MCHYAMGRLYAMQLADLPAASLDIEQRYMITNNGERIIIKYRNLHERLRYNDQPETIRNELKQNYHHI